MSSNKYIDSTIVLDNNVYHYKLAYSNRRSLSMSVNKNREIVVRTNKRFGKEALEKFIKKNIGKMYKRMQERKTNYIVDINNFIIIDEKKYILVYKISNNNKYIKKNDTYCIYYTNLKNRIKILKSLYDKLMCATLAKLNKLILWYFKKLNIKPVTIHHKWLYSRWGYCQVSSRKIFISSLLCSFNIEVIKYVIVHEICHLIHPNHSKKFWNTVSTLFPDYKLIRKNMKGNGVLIK